MHFIGQGIQIIQEQSCKKKLKTLDTFSGSGIVSRYLRQYSSSQYANDMEDYARIINECYLSNATNRNEVLLQNIHEELKEECSKRIKDFLTQDFSAFKCKASKVGFISEYYDPHNIKDIQKGERCFYTPYNACYIDTMRKLIEEKVPSELKCFFIAPLLSEASIHANTGGVFKGFYKNSKTGIGKFGGTEANALSRIQGHITLPYPIFSNFSCKVHISQQDANKLSASKVLPHVDLAYIDPPYNQHPYGSNYFMLNLIANYQKPNEKDMSKVSGIPKDWNRSSYNKRKLAISTFSDLVQNLNAEYLLISFNNEGFIKTEEMQELLNNVGTVQVQEAQYNAFRASRNLSSRNLHTKEYLYIVHKEKR